MQPHAIPLFSRTWLFDMHTDFFVIILNTGLLHMEITRQLGVTQEKSTRTIFANE